MPHEGFDQPWLSAGPLIPLDWLSMPEFVQKWHTPDLGALPSFPVGMRGGVIRVGFDPAPVQVPPVVPRADPTPEPAAPVITTIPDIPSGSVRDQETEIEGEEPVATLQDVLDWGTSAIDLYTQSQAPSPLYTPLGYVSSPPPVGAGDPVYNGVGQRALHCKKRRRRRPILTQTDIGILFQISTLPNNANVRTALARSIRR